MTSKTASQVVLRCEQILGWVPDTSVPLWKARAIAAHRLKIAMGKNPWVTWEHLDLAIEMLRQRKEPVRSPAYLVYKVPEALRLANDAPELSEVERNIERALDFEMRTPDDTVSRKWIGRFVRARGAGRKDVYNEWLRERGR